MKAVNSESRGRRDFIRLVAKNCRGLPGSVSATAVECRYA